MTTVEKLGKLLDDEPNTSSNLFNFPRFASDLENLLSAPDAITPFSIVVHGAWGSGKTSLIKRVFNSMEKKQKLSDNKTKLQVIWFDAWQYEKLDPVAALPQIIAKKYSGYGERMKNSKKWQQELV